CARSSDVEKSDVEKLDVEKSDVVKLDVEKSDVVKLDVEKSDVEKSDVEKSDVEKSDVEKSDVVKLDAEKSDIVKLDVEKSDVEKSDVVKLDAEKSDIVKLDVEKSDVKLNVEKSDVEKSDVEKLDVEKSDVEKLDVEKLDVEKSDVVKLDVENSDVENSDVEKSDVEETKIHSKDDGVCNKLSGRCNTRLAVSVSVSAWTLVTISVERYYGICYPLRARRWRSLRHAHYMISVVWAGSLLAMTPIAATSTLLPMKEKGRHKCRETWPTEVLEQGYNLFLVVVLLVIPLVLMLAAYCRISRVLWRDIREEGMPQGIVGRRDMGATTSNSSPGGGSSGSGSSQARRKALLLRTSRFYRPSKQPAFNTTPAGSSPQPPRCSVTTSILRKTHPEISLRNKKRVIHMLAAVVVEFFVCWTPLYVVNTLAYWFPQQVYHWLGMDGVVVIQLLAYCSCCCNPLTYCFMNHSFRRAFLNAIGCGKASRRNNTCDDARFISRKS
ncbi:cholecystokinin receptor-like, partial [Penaeus japonicus]|uniref:cholecystokinin receptor-like n=1 Tax=Penaeus japonicus TaxID=27405 RepID=UPI001C70E58E